MASYLIRTGIFVGRKIFKIQGTEVWVKKQN